MQVYWFRHFHENRNDWFNFGMMQLHYKGELQLTELPLSIAPRFGFDTQILYHQDLKAKSFLLFKRNGCDIRCIIDNEDSFVHVSDLVKEVDIYFMAAYNSDVFEKQSFPKFYDWQTDSDIAGYKECLKEKFNLLGKHFHKVKRFIPIAPIISVNETYPPLTQKFKNIRHRFRTLSGKGTDFSGRYKLYQQRYNQLLSLRKSKLTYDIVLNDSLWGWPKHRIRLHQVLAQLADKGYNINSILKYIPGHTIDGSDQLQLDLSLFPMTTNPLDGNYENMLSQSKLAVFACGFHWGWRNILMFSLMVGLPVVTDRLLTEAYFDMHEFRFWETEDTSWTGLETYLRSIGDKEWKEIKTHNQNIFDKYMYPETVAKYALSVIKSL